MVRVHIGCFAVLFLGATAMACTATPSVVDEPPPEENVAPPDDSKPSMETPPEVKPEPPDACAKGVECSKEMPKQGDACPCLSVTACFYEGNCNAMDKPDIPNAFYANCDGKQWVVETVTCPPSDQ